MRRISRHAALAAAMLLVTAVAHAEEGVKLRPLAPIYLDGAGAAIREPEGVGCRGDQVVVADTGNGQLLQYTMTADVMTAGASIRLPQLPYPTSVDINSKGEIFAVDRKLRRVARVAATGGFLGYLDLGDDSSRVTVVPWSVKVDRNDMVYVLDTYSGRIHVLTPEGAPDRQIAFPDEYGFLADIAVDAFGIVYAIDSVGKSVFRAEPGQERLLPLTDGLRDEANFPTSIATDASGHLFIADQHGGGVVVLGRDGSYRGRQSGMGWKEGFLRYPAALCLDETGDLFIADRGNNRVQVFFVIR